MLGDLWAREELVALIRLHWEDNVGAEKHSFYTLYVQRMLRKNTEWTAEKDKEGRGREMAGLGGQWGAFRERKTVRAFLTLPLSPSQLSARLPLASKNPPYPAVILTQVMEKAGWLRRIFPHPITS